GRMTVGLGEIHRSVLILVLGPDISALPEQLSDHLDMPVGGRKMEGRGPGVVLAVKDGAPCEEQADDLPATVGRGEVQGGDTVCISGPNIASSGIQECLHHFKLAFPSCIHEGCGSGSVTSIQVRTRVQQSRNQRRVTIRGNPMERGLATWSLPVRG